MYKDLPTADAKASTANLDKWLYELQKRVEKLEADNLAKDKTISDLKDQLAKSTTTAAPPNWGNLFKKNTQEEVIFLAKVATVHLICYKFLFYYSSKCCFCLIGP